MVINRKSDKMNDELVAKFRAYMRYNAYFTDWIWIYGNFPV